VGKRYFEHPKSGDLLDWCGMLKAGSVGVRVRIPEHIIAGGSLPGVQPRPWHA